MESRETKLWERYQAGLSYQREMGFTDQFPEYIRFKEDDQWPTPTKATRHLPRPVFNLVEFFIRTKRANILNQTIKMVFSPAQGLQGEAEEAGAKAYSDYAATLWKELGQDELNEDFVDDAATLGTGFLHYYWDADVEGGSRMPYKGALRGEVIDPLSISFGNPQESDLQKQPYILIASRCTVNAVKELARAQGLPPETIELICPDDERPDQYDAARREIRGEEKCTLLTLYYRVEGAVYFDRGTRSALLIEGRPLTPGTRDTGGEEGQEPPEPDLFLQETAPAPRITRYPLVAMSWRKRKYSIFGIGEAQGMIPTQKAVNWLMGMNVLSAQDTAWPKLLVKENALRQEITNQPGEIIRDCSATGDGIKYMQPPNFSGFAVNLVDKIVEMLRQVSGVTEVASGEPFTATMAASAIIALQNQAKQPIENIQRRFYRAMEEVGRIWEQFFKTYYDLARPMAVETPLGKEESGIFTGTDYAGVEFALEIDVGAGSEYSEALAQATLDKLYDKGDITLDTYIELAPKAVMPFKEQLKRILEQERQNAASVAGLPQGGGAEAPGEAVPLGMELPVADMMEGGMPYEV